ncbi:MAG: T9SS type A sorting domain-containing protein [Bacteroidia bacterium]|nr:T9SS type A sorting domain-containing protein [Bacteroidia bacterium]
MYNPDRFRWICRQSAILYLVGYKLYQGENNKLQLDITDLASGLYLLQIQRENKTQTFKIRKE